MENWEARIQKNNLRGLNVRQDRLPVKNLWHLHTMNITLSLLTKELSVWGKPAPRANSIYSYPVSPGSVPIYHFPTRHVKVEC